MTLTEVKKLSLGDRVRWTGRDRTEGIVVSLGTTGRMVRWDDGRDETVFYFDSWRAEYHAKFLVFVRHPAKLKTTGEEGLVW